MGRSTQTDCKPMIILVASVIALSSWSSLLIAVIIVWNPHHSMDVEGRVEVPLIIFAFVNSVTPQHTPPASLLLPVLGSVNNDKCRTSDADRSTLEVFHNCFSHFYFRQKFSNRCLARNQTISKLKLDKNDQLNLADQSLNTDVDISKNVKFNFSSELWFNIVLALLQRRQQKINVLKRCPKIQIL